VSACSSKGCWPDPSVRRKEPERCTGRFDFAEPRSAARTRQAASPVFQDAVGRLTFIAKQAPQFRVTNLLSIEIIWAAIGAMTFSISGQRLQRTVAVAVVLILLGFVGSNNEVLSDQQRVNRRDISMMTRIATDIASLDNEASVQRILFIGTNTSSLARIDTAADFSDGWHTYGTTLSVFAVWWPAYLVQLYNEVTGSQMAFATTPDQLAWAEQSCAGRRWPARGSVLGHGDLAVVCLGEPAKFISSQYDK
jgi:hypothetical protein